MKVYRRYKSDGKETIKLREVKRQNVCLGDYIYLESGDEVPADGELCESNSLLVDESNFTGEQFARKSAYEQDFDAEATFPTNKVLRGSTVIDGNGIFRVTAIGMDTVEGKGAAKTQEAQRCRYPAQQAAQVARLRNIESQFRHCHPHRGRTAALLFLFRR